MSDSNSTIDSNFEAIAVPAYLYSELHRLAQIEGCDVDEYILLLLVRR